MKIFWLLILALSLSSCAKMKTFHGPEQYYFGTYSEAERYYNKGEYEKAVVKYKAFLNEKPEGNLAVISQYYIGKSYAAMGKTADAKKVFKKLVKDYPDLVWANFAKNQLKEMELSVKKV
ncbi:MAG: tetratricopeptide repeat protein [Candidatus Omnitrophica bacterium]|nr:tetratricopeptide repeat protein [Candidatus Omnitrophota bacterium]